MPRKRQPARRASRLMRESWRNRPLPHQDLSMRQRRYFKRRKAVASDAAVDFVRYSILRHYKL
ncbi:hypothetical protein [Pectobacterium cacticida]|uniref:hypothetical protein n=1 Tax=Pectobacterium cacticida TaxID=69221 RepID=UPI002FF348FD